MHLIPLDLIFTSLDVSNLFLFDINTTMLLETIDYKPHSVIVYRILRRDVMSSHSMYDAIINHINTLAVLDKFVILMWSLFDWATLRHQLFIGGGN